MSQPYAPTQTPNQPTDNGLGLAALITGIVAFVCAFIPFLSFLAWIPALAAIGLGIAGLVVKNKKRVTALIGLILGALALLIGIVVSVVSLIGVASNISDRVQREIESEFPNLPSEAPFEDDEADEQPSATDWLDETYGTFDPVSHTGVGDSVIPLPAGAEGGLVNATHGGAANFSIQVIDASNQPTLDLLVNTIGAYSGTSAWGLQLVPGSTGANLQVRADGNWTISMSPMSAAPELAESGTGDGVYQYSGQAANLALTHDGQSNFQVSQYTSDVFPASSLVNEIGPYTGTVAMREGPSIIAIRADGGWTAALE